MHSAVAGVWASTSEKMIPALLVAAGAFCLGSLAGLILAFHSSGEGDALLASYLDQILQAVRSDTVQQPGAVLTCWRCLRWLLAVAVVGSTPLWIPGIPAVSGLRGFFLSFSAASFTRAYHGPGLEIAFLLIGLPALVSIPAFLLLGAQCFSLAWSGTGQHSYSLHWKHGCQVHAVVCIGMSLLSVFLELRLCPLLLRDISELVSSMRTF